jgi:hypothetical protein
MAYTYDQALAELSNRTTLDRLIDLVRNTSAKVEGAALNATSLLYAGDIDGKPSFKLAQALVDSTQNETGAGRFVRVDESGGG